MTTKDRGCVFLVGAGPGDPGLITVKGLEALQQAEVVVYDYLANAELLKEARPDAELIYVGKQAGQHTLSQEEINRLLVEKAQAGKTVARLKGGDPFVFGRGGEETVALAAAGVPFEVIPGVTSAVAAPAYAGIPVTQRGLASSFAVVTGHEDPTKAESAIDWHHLARGVDTLIFLMGVGNLPKIVADSAMLYQAFLNILINAIQAMHDGGTINVEISSTDSIVTILFEDEGCGIPGDLLEKIWTPFFTTKEKGTGLGLGIVKNIIASHGGSIKIENRLAGGAQVTVELPVKQDLGE